MRKILKFSLLYAFALTTQNEFWGNLIFEQHLWTIIKVAFILAIFELLLKPLIKVLLIPINFLTLGTIRIVVNTLGFYLASFLLADFVVNNIDIKPFIWQGFAIPTLIFTGFAAVLVNTVSTNFLLGLFRVIIKTKTIKK